MADIRCQSCDEPWEEHYLRYEAVPDTDWPAVAREPSDGRLTGQLRRAFERAGFRLGNSLFSIRSCPCCPKEARPNARGRRRGLLSDLAADLLPEDPDGLWSEIGDLNKTA